MSYLRSAENRSLLHRCVRMGMLLVATIATTVATDGSAPGIAQSQPWLVEAWSQAGAAAYQVAAKRMQARNGDGVPLDAFQKHHLRRFFGSLVDRVRVVYGAEMLDRLGNSALAISGVNAVGQTFCDRIYLRDAYTSRQVEQLSILAHELVHAKQCEQLGGLAGFGASYFREYRLANYRYADNRLEREAYDLQERFLDFMRQR